MTTLQTSNLNDALARLAHRSASAVVARARISHPAVNAALLRRLSSAPGHPDSLLADPIFETAKAWKAGDQTLGQLSGNLLDPDLVRALDQAQDYRMKRDLRPYAHQLATWRASLEEEKSVLVTSGTGSGKTECFLIPLLNDLLGQVRPGGGVQAILLYPLNALIESQRERLSAWAEGLGGRVRFALYNGDTPESPRKAGQASSSFELRNRRDIRATPPDILVTNITMLEYLLLREQDRTLVELSQGALRWIVLDEAHSYVGSQAAEMALLLRRVRTAFGVDPAQVRLIATSATIGGEPDAVTKLQDFTAALAGQDPAAVTVIEGQEEPVALPQTGADLPLDVTPGQAPDGLWAQLAGHPRLQALRKQMSVKGLSRTQIARVLFDDPARTADAQRMLDCAALAVGGGGHRLLPWRAHVFHRAQGGVFACVDPECPHRDTELSADGSRWPFGAVHLGPRPACACGAPVLELVSCMSCGTPHLQAQLVGGAQPRLETPELDEGDDFALDAEPDGDTASSKMLALLVRGSSAGGYSAWITKTGARIHDNAPPDGETAWRYAVIEQPSLRGCCADAQDTRLQGLRFGPAFFLGNAVPQALENLAPPSGKLDLPAEGRRAITFSDSRQGVARLAAKLQQDSERTLTRSFLWHAVQEKGSGGDAEEITKLEQTIEKFRSIAADALAEQIAEAEGKLAQLKGTATAPVPWPSLVQRFAEQEDLKSFAGEVWRSRKLGGRLGDNPVELAQMFLFREMFRRPKVQNNPETMGLVRLSFPALEAAAASAPVPAPLAEVGVDRDGWLGLVMAAIDSVFRDRLAARIPEWMVPIVSPRFGKLNVILSRPAPHDDRAADRTSSFWPGPNWKTRPGRLQTLVFGLIGGAPDDPQNQDRAAEVLDAIWSLVIRHAARDTGAGRWQLDFDKAAVVKLGRAWICPVTRRPYGWTVAGRSPYDITRMMEEVHFPELPVANAGGLASGDRAAVADWAQSDPQVAFLRARGLWSDLHDRIAGYPSFLRAQEHSAQIERAVLKTYEDQFNAGRINLLNCSTTMEMGVDLEAVQLVVNANVPPALSNYRQRIGRAGRRREPWAFGLTFCRDLPLDRQAFLAPGDFLSRQIAAPKVWFDSAPLVQRHVNATLLALWLGERGGTNVKASTGSFLGAQEADATPMSDAAADRFLTDLRGDWGAGLPPAQALQALVFGTALEGRSAAQMIDQAAAAMERFVADWRREYRELLDRRDGAGDPEVAQAFGLRAKRMAGEFLLGDLARRGFTPAYGFPTDVVTFDPLISGHSDDRLDISYNKRSGASRELHQAIREYAPGSEVVIDGLVYESEGVRPAWGADADASKLEDMGDLWECRSCRAFGVTQGVPPETCPDCAASAIERTRILRPAGFLTRKQPHTGYEALQHTPAEPARISARGVEWTALPVSAVGRYRHDSQGLVISRSSGRNGGGFALCLACGRAEPMDPSEGGLQSVLPEAIRKHRPLARSATTKLTHDGHCPGGYTEPHRVQRHVHLAQSARTDVFELQLSAAAQPAAGLALAAALREALAERLGVESREIGVGTAPSRAPTGETRISALLYDHAAGGAGLVARLDEPEMLRSLITRAEKLLDCRDSCVRGCPSCILQPDLSRSDIRMDRAGALGLARLIGASLFLPDDLQAFGQTTQPLGQSLMARIEQLARSGALRHLDLYLHGSPTEWDLPGWPPASRLRRLKDEGITIDVHIPDKAITHAGFDLGTRLSLYRLAGAARIRRAGDPPLVRGMPVIAKLDTSVGGSAVASAAFPEALPGVDWALGAQAPLLVGPWAGHPSGDVLSLERIMELGSGSGRILTPGEAVSGAAQGFGIRFWRWMAGHVPLDLAAFQSHGVTAISYSDRYLLTPVTLWLAAEVLRNVPGGRSAAMTVDLAPNSERRGAREPERIYESYHDDLLRGEALRELLPGAKIRMARHRNDLPHRREMRFVLSDGRVFRLLLDQGFGAWRAQASKSAYALRHDFGAGAVLQAASLGRAEFNVSGGDEPVIWGPG